MEEGAGGSSFGAGIHSQIWNILNAGEAENSFSDIKLKRLKFFACALPFRLWKNQLFPGCVGIAVRWLS
jgi:hypothetical protein